MGVEVLGSKEEPQARPLEPEIAEASLDPDLSLVTVERHSVADALVRVGSCLSDGRSDLSQDGVRFGRGGADVFIDAFRGGHRVPMVSSPMRVLTWGLAPADGPDRSSGGGRAGELAS